MSTFTWLDYSQHQHRRMLELVRMFSEPGTLDELGIGPVRDAFSESLFPGTSTLHTRARYLLFVPWLCLKVEAERPRSHRAAADRLAALEYSLVGSLRAGDAGPGIIGIVAGRSVKQTPSSVYWSALGRHGVRIFPGSRDQYMGTVTGLVGQPRDHPDDDGVPLSRAWHPGLPSPPASLLDSATFQLTASEADYVTERILRHAPGTLLAHMVRQAPVTTAGDDLPWHHPWSDGAPKAASEALQHARNFSGAMHGAALLYNLILAELVEDARSAGGEFKIDAGLSDKYRTSLAEWADRMSARSQALAAWDRRAFWRTVLDFNPRVPFPTRAFIDRWLDLGLADPFAIADSTTARELIRQREVAVKRRLARVANPRQLERWSGESGTGRLEFRWRQVRQVVTDIVAGRAMAA